MEILRQLRPIAKRRLALRLGILLLVALACSREAYGAELSREYGIKAAFLYNFSQFIDWPPGTLPKEGDFTIGIVGDDPFGRVLDEIVEGQEAHGRRIRVLRLRGMEGIERCQILFLPKGNTGDLDLEKVHQIAAEFGILTVGEGTFARRGGMIALVTVENRVRFEVNLDQIRRHGFSISSRLLRLAKPLTPTEEGG
jgi:hypothetical protein